MPDVAPFRYDATANRYRHVQSGRFVPDATVRSAVDQVLNDTASSVQGLTEQLRSGAISVQEWRSGMEASIKSAHVAAGVAARGGFAQASQADYGWIGSQIKTQYQYLDRFAAQIVSGAQPLDGTLTSRADLYAQAGRVTHREMERRMARIGGKSEEKSVLGAADHCEGCVGAASQGWQPIGTLPAVGSRECLSRCHCRMIFRDAAAAFEEAA